MSFAEKSLLFDAVKGIISYHLKKLCSPLQFFNICYQKCKKINRLRCLGVFWTNTNCPICEFWAKLYRNPVYNISWYYWKYYCALYSFPTLFCVKFNTVLLYYFNIISGLEEKFIGKSSLLVCICILIKCHGWGIQWTTIYRKGGIYS